MYRRRPRRRMRWPPRDGQEEGASILSLDETPEYLQRKVRESSGLPEAVVALHDAAIAQHYPRLRRYRLVDGLTSILGPSGESMTQRERWWLEWLPRRARTLLASQMPFSYVSRGPAALLQRCRERRYARTEWPCVVDDTMPLDVTAGEERCSAGSAQWEGCVRPLECNDRRRRGECVDGRRLGERVARAREGLREGR